MRISNAKIILSLMTFLFGLVSPVLANNYGINYNGGPKSNTISNLKKLGVKDIRVWFDISSWDDTSKISASKVNEIKTLYDAGFRILVIVNPSNGLRPSGSTLGAKQQKVKNIFNALVNKKDSSGTYTMAQMVTIWEIGNETNDTKYWNGSLSSYVQEFLSPAADVLKSKGELVATAGPSYGVTNVQTIITAAKAIPGLWNKIDYIGFHAYAGSPKRSSCSTADTNVAGALSRIKSDSEGVKSIAGGKPLIASEWAVKLFSYYSSAGEYVVCDSAKRADANVQAFQIINKYYAYAHYFAAFDNKTQQAGTFSIFTSSGDLATSGKIKEAYDAFKSFPSSVSSIGGQNGGSSLSSLDSSTPTLGDVFFVNSNNPNDFYKLNARNNTLDMAVLQGGKTFNSFMVEAEAGSDTSKIDFVFNGTLRSDGSSPFTAFNSDLELKVGKYVLDITPKSSAGVLGETIHFEINIIDSDVTPSNTGVTVSGLVTHSTKGALYRMTVYFDTNNNNILDSGEIPTTTASDGSYKLINLPTDPGTDPDRVRVVLNGYTQVTPTNNYGYSINQSPGSTNTGKNFVLSGGSI